MILYTFPTNKDFYEAIIHRLRIKRLNEEIRKQIILEMR